MAGELVSRPDTKVDVDVDELRRAATRLIGLRHSFTESLGSSAGIRHDRAATAVRLAETSGEEAEALRQKLATLDQRIEIIDSIEPALNAIKEREAALRHCVQNVRLAVITPALDYYDEFPITEAVQRLHDELRAGQEVERAIAAAKANRPS